MKRTEHAAELACEAMSEELISDEYERSGIDPTSAAFHKMQAEVLQRKADDLLILDNPPQTGAGGEVIPGEAGTHLLARNTLEAPDAVNVEGSAKRIDYLLEAGILAPGLDAAQSIDAKNSLEKMLAHQMALCHDAAFRTISEAGYQESTVERVRLLNAGARLLKAFQDGLLALNKIRTGGKQTVLVQHVQVSDGGQAVVSGTVKEGTDGG